ncbi:MAG: hypothetical protein ABI233_05200 [Chthoniobacterales bacterium]
MKFCSGFKRDREPKSSLEDRAAAQFGIALPGELRDVFGMPRPLLRSSLPALCILFGVALFLTGCANSDIAGPPNPAAAGDADVPGAAAPAPNANSAGWW